jgi:hypothetical protein
MRLLEANADVNFSLTGFVGTKIPSYAILSHTWEADNVARSAGIAENKELD